MAPAARVDLHLPAAAPIEPRPELAALVARLAPAFYLDLGTACNQRCLYCFVDRSKPAQVPASEILALAEGAVAAGFARAILVGGEPTVRADLLRLLAGLRGRGVREFVLLTNGTMLAAPANVARLAGAGVRLFGVSFDDPRPDQQRRLARHRQLPALLDAALAHVGDLARAGGAAAYLGAVLCRANAGALDAYLEAVLRLRDATGHDFPVIFGFVKLEAAAWENRGAVGLRIEEAAAAVRGALELGQRKGLAVFYRDLPPCTLPGWESSSADLYLQDRSLDLHTGALGPPALATYRRHFPACAPCRWRPWCPGVYRGYVAAYGEPALGPAAIG